MEHVTTESTSASSSGSRTPKSGGTTPRSSTTAKRLSIFRHRRKSQAVDVVDAPSQFDVADVIRKYSANSSSFASNPLSPREDLFFETSETVKPFPDGASQKTIVLQGLCSNLEFFRRRIRYKIAFCRMH